MARTISQILSGLKSSLQTFASAVNITINPLNWSKTDYKELILNTVASAVGIQEQQFDQVKVDVKDVAKTIPPLTFAWLQNQMINVFEYDATQVPIVQFDTINFVPNYPNPNPNFNIVKYCSPKSAGFGVTEIKIAGVGPSVISGTALSAAQTFANTITTPGITYVVVSRSADRLFMQLDLYYNGLYSAVIEANVIAALSAFLLKLSTTTFDGIIKLSDITVELKKVAGVVDAVFNNVKVRTATQTVGTGTTLVFNNSELQKDYQMYAGYSILEDDSSGMWRLSDYRNGVSGIKNLNLIAV